MPLTRQTRRNGRNKGTDKRLQNKPRQTKPRQTKRLQNKLGQAKLGQTKPRQTRSVGKKQRGGFAAGKYEYLEESFNIPVNTNLSWYNNTSATLGNAELLELLSYYIPYIKWINRIYGAITAIAALDDPYKLLLDELKYECTKLAEELKDMLKENRPTFTNYPLIEFTFNIPRVKGFLRSQAFTDITVSLTQVFTDVLKELGQNDQTVLKTALTKIIQTSETDCQYWNNIWTNATLGEKAPACSPKDKMYIDGYSVDFKKFDKIKLAAAYKTKTEPFNFRDELVKASKMYIDLLKIINTVGEATFEELTKVKAGSVTVPNGYVDYFTGEVHDSHEYKAEHTIDNIEPIITGLTALLNQPENFTLTTVTPAKTIREEEDITESILTAILGDSNNPTKVTKLVDKVCTYLLNKIEKRSYPESRQENLTTINEKFMNPILTIIRRPNLGLSEGLSQSLIDEIDKQQVKINEITAANVQTQEKNAADQLAVDALVNGIRARQVQFIGEQNAIIDKHNLSVNTEIDAFIANNQPNRVLNGSNRDVFIETNNLRVPPIVIVPPIVNRKNKPLALSSPSSSV